MRADLKKWYDQSLALVPEVYREEVAEYLAPLVPHCRAKSRPRYWMWLRQQLAKDKEIAEFYFEYLRESDLPVEQDAPFLYEVNADVALIDLGVCVWKLPLKDLTWAKSIWPVYVRELPPLESPELAEARSLKARMKNCRLGFNERRLFEKAFDEVTALIAAGDIRKMPHRHGVFKKVDGVEISVARLYLRCDVNEDVEALDGDPTNFGNVPASTIAQPIYHDGVAILPGIADPMNPVRVTPNGAVPNLYIVQECSDNLRYIRTVPSEEPDVTVPQQEFEKKFLQVKVDSEGQMLHPHAADMDGELILATSKTTPSNFDLCHNTGVEGGKIEDCGRFKPLSVNEAAELGLTGFETQKPEEIEPDEASA